MFQVFIVDFENTSFVFESNQDLKDIFFHIFGNIVIIHKNISINHEKYHQKFVGISINKVVDFNNIENIITEIQSENIIT
jgi:hypothetical protein